MLTKEARKETAAVATSGFVRPALGNQIIRNVMFGGLRYVFVVPIPFIMIPLILHKIGVAGYGTWAVFLAINGLTSLADLGLVGTLSKFVAEYHATQDFPSLSRALNSGLGLFLLIDLALCSALWGLSPLLAGRLFRGSPVSHVELVSLFRIFLIVVVANVLTQPLASVTTGLQRLDLTNMISAASVTLSAVFSAVLLLEGWGLRGLVYGYCAAAMVTVAAYVVVVRRLLPQIIPNPFGLNGAEARKMFGFSLRLYITQAAVAVHNQVEKLYLGMLVGVAAVGWYDMASDIALKVRNGLSSVLAPVLPAASELNAVGDESRMRELFYRTHKYLALVGVPAVCYVAAISHRFVELWVGPSLAVVAFPLSILVLVNFVNLATGPGFLILAGKGDLSPGIQSAALGIGVNLLLSLGLIYRFGFAGAVVGTSVSLIAGSAFFMALFHHRSGYPVMRVLREGYLKPTLCSIPLVAVLLAVWPASRLSWLGLLGIGVCFGILYAVVVLLSRFFDEYDWVKIEKFAPGVRSARRLMRIA
ncbi:MAG: oligosaccharide flippase family protein [Candidatus Sulfotelmatobacter sp.]